MAIEAVADVTVIDMRVGWDEDCGDDELHPAKRAIAFAMTMGTECLINRDIPFE